MSVEDAKAALAGLEGKLSDAMARRDKIIIETSRASAEAATARGINSARNSLGPLNKQAKVIDSEIALLRTNITMARRRLELAEAHAESVKAKQAADRGETGRLVQLEISAPDGRVLRQFHKSVDAARKALQAGYTVTGEVISGNIVSPIGPGARSFMTSLLDAGGGELLEFLEAHGIVGSDKQAVVVLPANNRELQ
jgi:septal ring factor EnvC (AmiA/AmiB activator)